MVCSLLVALNFPPFSSTSLPFPDYYDLLDRLLPPLPATKDPSPNLPTNPMTYPTPPWPKIYSTTRTTVITTTTASTTTTLPPSKKIFCSGLLCISLYSSFYYIYFQSFAPLREPDRPSSTFARDTKRGSVSQVFIRALGIAETDY